MEHCNKSRELLERLSAVKAVMGEACTRAGRDRASVRLVAVSKGQAAESLVSLAEAGILDFGENYLQEWHGKAAEIQKLRPDLAHEIRWHFIGHLQSNKAKDVAGACELIHSVDSLKLATKLNQAAEARALRQPVLWEIKLAEEKNKSGLSPDAWLKELPHYAALPWLDWRGLMLIPPPVTEGRFSLPYFERLKSLLDEGNRSGVLKRRLSELSMGMSEDYPEAIAAGATLIRVGTALFGARKK